MPKDYDRRVDFTEEGEVDLESKLRKMRFRVEGRFMISNIYDTSVQGNRQLGHIEIYNGRVLLYIVAMKDNPLEGFVKNYGSIDLHEPKPKPHLKSRQF